ncbi:hypothetical protein ACJX0J_029715, partial [Zea mays]
EAQLFENKLANIFLDQLNKSLEIMQSSHAQRSIFHTQARLINHVKQNSELFMQTCPLFFRILIAYAAKNTTQQSIQTKYVIAYVIFILLDHVYLHASWKR